MADPSWSKGVFVISRGFRGPWWHLHLPWRPCCSSLVYGHNVAVSRCRILHKLAHGVESESMLWKLHHIGWQRCENLGVDGSMPPCSGGWHLRRVESVHVFWLKYFLILQRHHGLIRIGERVSRREHDLSQIRQITRILLAWTEGRLRTAGRRCACAFETCDIHVIWAVGIVRAMWMIGHGMGLMVDRALLEFWWRFSSLINRTRRDFCSFLQ